MEADLEKSPTSIISNSLNGSMSPIPDFEDDDGNDALPPTSTYAQAHIIPVTDRADIQLGTDDDDSDDEETHKDKQNQKQADRFSIFAPRSKPALVNRTNTKSNHTDIGSTPNSPKSDDEDDPNGNYPFTSRQHSNMSNVSNHSNLSPHFSNGHSNGHSNGYSNGHSNGYSNGHLNGHSNNSNNSNGHHESNGHPPPQPNLNNNNNNSNNSNNTIPDHDPHFHIKLNSNSHSYTNPQKMTHKMSQQSSASTVKSNKSEKPMSIQTATLQSSTSSASNPFKISEITNSVTPYNKHTSKLSQLSAEASFPMNISTKSTSVSRKDSPGFTLNDLGAGKSKGKLGSIPEKSDNLSTAKLADISSASLINQQQTSAFDVVHLDDMNTNSTNPQKSNNIPKMKIEHTNMSSEQTQGRQFTNRTQDDSDDSDHEQHHSLV